MDRWKEYYLSLGIGRCHPCEYAKSVMANGQWMFLGCFHEPYHGKWVKEIKDCPKQEVNNNDD